jgi:hypothetical protein
MTVGQKKNLWNDLASKHRTQTTTTTTNIPPPSSTGGIEWQQRRNIKQAIAQSTIRQCREIVVFAESQELRVFALLANRQFTVIKLAKRHIGHFTSRYARD